MPIFVDGETVGKGPTVEVAVEPGQTVEVFGVIDGQMRKSTVTFPDTQTVDLRELNAER